MGDQKKVELVGAQFVAELLNVYEQASDCRLAEGVLAAVGEQARSLLGLAGALYYGAASDARRRAGLRESERQWVISGGYDAEYKAGRLARVATCAATESACLTPGYGLLPRYMTRCLTEARRERRG